LIFLKPELEFFQGKNSSNNAVLEKSRIKKIYLEIISLFAEEEK